ncbi:putative DD34D transposase [Trichonephila clavipes]|nr:putative DD34D transposase [Trichonephila clavipes]
MFMDATKYRNIRHITQTVAKPGRFYCILAGIICYEWFPYGQPLISDSYCQQLKSLKLVMAQKRPELANRRGVVFHQETAGHSHLQTFGWEVLMHPLYSSDLSPSDYYVFLALQNFLSDKKLEFSEIKKIDY